MKSLTLILLFVIGTAYAKDWWVNGNFYQIYPRSFRDSDGDGIGDLNGVAEKLQYLKDIGITAIWLSPIFKSPMVDFGYDIADYYQIHPEYGTIDDFENLMKKAKEIGMKILLDFVPNHTSDESEWFKKSIDGIEPYSSYYIWEDPIIDKNGERHPPSNWLSAFRYSAWEWNEVRQQYYLHQFAIQQPDLNYRNPNVVNEMKNILTFWLHKGVSGFRIDAVPFLFEKEKIDRYENEPLSNDPNCPDANSHCYLTHIYTQDQNETYDMLYQWRKLCDDFKKNYGGETRILMTEAYTSLDNIIRYYGNGIRNGSHVPFNFELISNTNNNSNAEDFSKNIDNWMNKMPAGVYANWVMGNHDNKRLASRYGVSRADLFNILLQTLPGNAVTYYGEELAMTDVFIDWANTVDPQACNGSPETFNQLSRDPARTPFQWDASTSAGFSSNTRTWLPVSSEYLVNNAMMQSRAPISHLQVFKKLTKLRQVPSFQEGTFEKKTIEKDILIYKREKPNSDAYVVILNFGTSSKTINIQEHFPKISDKVEIITTSIHSDYTDGEIIDATKFIANAEVGTIVVSVNQ